MTDRCNLVTFIRKDESKAITISNGTESSIPEVRTKFVEHPVEAKAFAKVRMEVFFLAMTMSSDKGDMAKATFRVFLHNLHLPPAILRCMAASDSSSSLGQRRALPKPRAEKSVRT